MAEWRPEMSAVELNEKFLVKIAGWEAVKQARSLLERGNVLSSNWTPPILKGVVQEGTISYRAGLVIKDSIDLENMCSCRASRQYGTICAHSVAVGLHHLNREARESQSGPASNSATRSKTSINQTAASTATARVGRRILRAAPEERGEPAEIHVILPPNFLAAAAKGKIMICFEGRTNRGRAPLNALGFSTRFAFPKEDLAVLDTIETLAEGETPAMLMIEGPALDRLLETLVDHPRITLGKSQEISVIKAPWRVPVQARLEKSGEIWLALGGHGLAQQQISGTNWIFAANSIQQLSLPKGYNELLRGPLKLPRSRVPQFLSQDWPVLLRECDIDSNFRIEDFSFAPQPPRFHLALTGGLAQLQAQLQCAYGPRIMTLGVTAITESLWLPDAESPTKYSTRDLAAEQAALGRLLRSGFTGPDAQGRYQLLGQNAVLNFFAREFPRLEREWSVTLEERLEKSTAKNLERIAPQCEVTPSGEQWFDLSVSYTTASGEKFSAAEIQRLLLSGQSHTRLRNGRIAVIDTGAVEELQEVLLDCAPQQHDGAYRIANQQSGFLEATMRQQPGWQFHAPTSWHERAAQQTGEAQWPEPSLGALASVLRPYQKAGVGWMNFLRQNYFGGILADEMGLGKTLQALAYVHSLKLAQGDSGLRPDPVLVVCPTSLVFNWVAEAKRFTPDLKVVSIHGPQRQSRFAELAEADLVVTSYALIRRDAEHYRDCEFDTVILDEAQHIKNRQTQNAQAVKSIRSRHRLVLTGTPLENSVLDLWSIFDFLMPGYLGAAKDFRERYEIPIAREKSSEVQARLARRIRPFLLRRLKREVAKELPEKLEQVSYCELTEQQRGVYQQVLEAGRQEIVKAVDAQGLQKSRMMILNALLRLRQICCDLRLLKLEQVDAAEASGKLDLFGELLEEIIDGGHRALVFSQFVSMLTLLRERLDAEGIEYCYLDGSTPDRAGVVQRFQGNAKIPIFLISLKAGGVGLNLTGADTVIHFDPWWNPAVEDQATDRAHRIGQTRVVTSYKLITRGTVEEKILNLQERKRAIIQSTLGSEEEFASALTWEEIRELFQ
ncbi:MAG: SNF2-related protein [Verrucomicrobiota bacterium]